MFQLPLYHGSQIYRLRKLEYSEKTTDLPQVCNKLIISRYLTHIIVVTDTDYIFHVLDVNSTTISSYDHDLGDHIPLNLK
jgi:hypothetical protein